MGNGRGEPAHHRGLLDLVKLCFEFACSPQSGCHVIERGGQRADFIVTIGGNPDVEVAGRHLARRHGEILYRPGETPNKNHRNEDGCDQ